MGVRGGFGGGGAGGSGGRGAVRGLLRACTLAGGDWGGGGRDRGLRLVCGAGEGRGGKGEERESRGKGGGQCPGAQQVGALWEQGSDEGSCCGIVFANPIIHDAKRHTKACCEAH